MTSPVGPAAVDVHGHFGKSPRGPWPLENWFMSAEIDEVLARAAGAGIGRTVVSPLRGLLPRLESDAVAGNDEASAVVRSQPQLRQWVIIDPTRPETYAQADRMLRDPWCVGVKIHPEEHGYHITDHGKAIFDFCADRGTVVLAHSGEERSLPADYLPLADDHAEVSLILAHIGCGFDDDPSHQVRAIQASRHGNVYGDTSSARSIVPRLIEWAVSEVGADKVLFGSDSPMYFAGSQLARIEQADLSAEDRALVIAGNAIRLLGLTGDDDDREPPAADDERSEQSPERP